MSSDTEIYENLIERVVEAVLREERLEGASVDVSFVTADEIRALNNENRGIDAVTDVLSFPLYDNREDYVNRLIKEEPLLGDIVICLERAREQAGEYGHSLEREVGFLAAHGALHCCWYDHEQADDERVMIGKQDRVMGRLNLSRDAAPSDTPPRRKHNRLNDYDYSSEGAYFLTICAKDRAPVFRRGGILPPALIPELTDVGIAVENEISVLSNTYEGVYVDCYVVMPNHVHMILVIEDVEGGRQNAAPTVGRVMNMWKRAISRKIGFSPWQKSFYDRVIRSAEEYAQISEYIETNPQMWAEDNDNINLGGVL